MLTKVAEIGFDDQLDPLQKEILGRRARSITSNSPAGLPATPRSSWNMAGSTSRWATFERKLGHFRRVENKPIGKRSKFSSRWQEMAARDNDAKRSLARTFTLLADILVRHGADKGKAEPLYRQAAELQQALVGAPNPLPEDQLHLGQTLRSQGELARLNGQFTQAKPVYDQAIKVLDDAHAADAEHAEIRNELALATDARGSINRDLAELKMAGLDYRRALELLETLVAEFPTVTRYRQSLAKAYNSLGLLEENAGSLVEADRFYRRELPLVERLTQDFPDRPEHGRELARTLSNLGNVLARNRDAGADAVLRRAVEVNAPLSVKHPEDVQIRFDLAKDYQCLGDSRARARKPRRGRCVDPPIAVDQRIAGQGIPR